MRRWRSIRRPLAFAAVSGMLIGTIGFATEYAWTQVAFRLPWQPDLLPEGVAFAIAGGVAGGLVGALMALGLRGQLPRPAVARTGVALAGAIVAVGVAVPLMTSSVPQGVRAAVELTDVTGSGASREAQATVRVTPASAADDNKWLTVTSWQGGGLHVDRLERVGEGVYRTTEPMPVGGDWKTLVRLHKGTDLTAAPVYLPEDPAIPRQGDPGPRALRAAVRRRDRPAPARAQGRPARLAVGRRRRDRACALPRVLRCAGVGRRPPVAALGRRRASAGRARAAARRALRARPGAVGAKWSAQLTSGHYQDTRGCADRHILLRCPPLRSSRRASVDVKGQDRRAPGSRLLRAGALRCEDCGTTWFDQLAEQIAGVGRRCRRCGGRLHTERRDKQSAVTRAA